MKSFTLFLLTLFIATAVANAQPIITQQPTNQLVALGSNTTFSAAATGTPPLRYQWYFTNSAFTTAGAYAQALNGFVYGVVVTNGGVGYTVSPQVRFVSGGGSGAAAYAVVSEGLVTGITVTSAGSGYTTVPAVQIDRPNGLLANETNATLSLNAVTPQNVGAYYCIITNAFGSVTSGVATLNLFPSIVNQPQSLSVWAGSSGAFSVAADNTGPFTYQWQFNGANIPGATSNSFTINQVEITNAGSYTVAVSNLCGGLISSGAVLTVNYISQPPTNQTVVVGQTAIFNVGVTGPGPFSYQWRFNGTGLPSASQPTLTLTNVAAANAGIYDVIITSPNGSVLISAAALNILFPPSILTPPEPQNVAQGSSASVSVTAGGTPPFSYQWWMNGSPQSNATAVPVVINGFVLGATVTSGGAGYLAVPGVQIVGGSGSGAGGYAILSNRMVSAIILTNAGSGYATPPSIQIDGPSSIMLSGQTNSTLALLAVSNTNSGSYFISVTNAYGSVTSIAATLAVQPFGYNQIAASSLNGNNVQLKFIGLPSQYYALQTTTNLSPPAQWQTVFADYADNNGIWQFIDYNLFAVQKYYRLNNTQPTFAPSMSLIPAGPFTMGDTLDGIEAPVTVTVSAFYMDTHLVSYSQWTNVYAWAVGHGYAFDHVGSAKAATHPVLQINWWDIVKWCNARSEKENKRPAYYANAGLTAVYRSGQLSPSVNWAAGYRLPTDAEWEKAARGGLSGQRFPWGNTISHSLANFNNGRGESYQTGPTGFNAAYATGNTPYTSPVGSFAPNGYGLFDMSGNVWQWCWDWYGGPYAGGTDPRGAASGSYRVNRGGDWSGYAMWCRTAYRHANEPLFTIDLGFRSVLPPGQ